MSTVNPPRGVMELARPDIVAMDAYTSARNEGWARTLLDANESPVAPRAGEAQWNRYPHPQDPDLLARFAALYGVPEACLMVGRGADEAIDILPRVFCRAGRDAVVITSPTYGMYGVSARIQGAPVVDVPLRRDDFGLDVTGIVREVDRGARVVFLCAPNNPLGTPVSQSDIAAVLDGVDGRAIVVLDEAYIEFAGTTASCAPLTARYENLVVLRTLSKAYALAGVRCGVAIAAPSVIGLLNKVRAPYPLSRPSIAAVGTALDEDETATRIAQVRSERERLASALRDAPATIEVLPSVTNFVFVRVHDARPVLEACATRDIRIRDRSAVGLGPAVRITVGAPDENDAVIDAVRTAPPPPSIVREPAAYA